MIPFEKYQLDNGLTVILHVDRHTPLVAVNIAYNVGSKVEHPDHTGLAHLFEHLMFTGSQHAPDFDSVLQRAGGENNAFTNTDLTNYYLTVPADNLELALWLESDRMQYLSLSAESLEKQRKVVIEEFKQNYLNQPYGDLMLLLKPLAYQVHPYRWNTIGKEISHIAKAQMTEIKTFYQRYYCPDNAVLCIAGHFDLLQTKKMVEKWFGEIPPGHFPSVVLPQEPVQLQSRFLEVERNVPNDMLLKAYHCCKRADDNYYPTDMITDILSNGKSARLQRHLVEEQSVFSNISAYVTGTFDEGLFIISGSPNPGVSLQSADEALEQELRLLSEQIVPKEELDKTKNKIRTLLYYADLQVQDKAMNLSIFELLDQAERYDWEESLYNQVDALQIQAISRQLFTVENCSTLYYRAIE